MNRSRRVTALVVVCLSTAFLAAAAGAGELSKEEKKWAKACLERLGAGSPPVRSGAERALAALGTDAVPMLAEAWWNAHEEVDAELIESVFLKIGRDVARGRLRRMREDARGGKVKMLDALIGVLADAGSEDGASTSPSGPPSGLPNEKEEAKWVKECLKRFRANSPRVRSGAERALATLGITAMPDLVDTWVKARSRTELAAVKRVLVEIGRDAVVKRLRPLREGARGAEAKRLDALLSELGASSEPGSTDSYPLAPSSTLDWQVVPFGAEHAVGDRMPEALDLGRCAARREGPDLVVDVDGDGTVETRLEAGEAKTLWFRARGAERPVLLYEKLGRWYACSASLQVGKAGSGSREVSISLLDGDLDGSFVGERDHLRIGDGAFHRYREDGLVLWGEDRARYELVQEGSGHALRLEVLERPGSADKGAWGGLVALNRFRSDHGLAPLGYDAQRSSACRKHAEYLAANRKRGRKDTGGTTHDETPGLPGYTQAGAQAGASSNIGSGGDLARTVERFGRTMLHRVASFCESNVSVGLGATRRAGGWSVIWAGSPVADGDVPVLVPAPGAHGVPRGGASEWPPPDRVPGAYTNRVGYPVSVTFEPIAYTGVNLVLTAADGKTPVPGHVFTPAQPIASRFPRNGASAFYLPSSPLEHGAQYWAVFTATQGGKPVRFAWTFFVD